MLAGLASNLVARLDGTNVLCFGNPVVSNGRSTSGTLSNSQVETACLHSSISVGRGVVVDKLDGWNRVLTLIARNSQEVIDHVTFNTIGCEACLVGHLGIIGVEVLGECNHRLLDEF